MTDLYEIVKDWIYIDDTVAEYVQICNAKGIVPDDNVLINYTIASTRLKKRAKEALAKYEKNPDKKEKVPEGKKTTTTSRKAGTRKKVSGVGRTAQGAKKGVRPQKNK